MLALVWVLASVLRPVPLVQPAAEKEWQNRFGGRHTEVEANPSSRRRTSGRYDRSVGNHQRVH
jgi:hypothetical protein